MSKMRIEGERCKIPYKTCRLWRLLEAILRKSSKKHPKSITFI